ncbi:hypothetical protein [Clostridium sp. UBA5988]|uniref:hypothetical protein n=1 Tax=Clostridium sp. UBA5988 TaxID=1946369 RepID=UPI003216EA64
MEEVNKTLVTSLYNKINLYLDIVEIFEYLQKEFLSYFKYDSSITESMTKEFIGDFNTFVIVEEKERIEEVFHKVYTSEDHKVSSHALSKEVKIDKKFIHDILDSIEKNINSRLNLFKKKCELEVYTFHMKHDEKEIYNELNRYIYEDMEGILSYIEIGVVQLKNIVMNALNEEIKSYHRFIWNTVKELIIDLRGKDTLNKGDISDKIIIKEDEILYSLDILKEKISEVVRKEFIEVLLNLINEAFGDEFTKRIKVYKKELNKYLAKEICESNLTKIESVGYATTYDNSMKNREYTIGYKVFSLEHDFLNMMMNISKFSFDEITDEIELSINSIFYNEFTRLIYYINSEEEFYAMCRSFQDKFNYITCEIIKSSLKSIKDNYYNSIIDILMDNMKSISGINVFKSIDSYRGNIKVYNQGLIMDLYNKWNKMYGNYNELKKYCIDISNILILDEKDILKEYFQLDFKEDSIFKGEYYCDFKALERKKEELYNNIVLIKEKLLKTLQGDFTTYFDHLFQSIGKNLEYAKSEERYYNFKIKPSDM